MDEPISVLFVCTANSARSQMAEGWLRHLGGERFAVVSAGTKPATRVHPLAVATMAEVGIDIAQQLPKDVRAMLDRRFDYVITVCDRASETCPVVPGDGERFHWSFEDPAAAEGSEEQRRRAFRRLREEIRARVALFVPMQHSGRPDTTRRHVEELVLRKRDLLKGLTIDTEEHYARSIRKAPTVARRCPAGLRPRDDGRSRLEHQRCPTTRHTAGNSDGLAGGHGEPLAADGRGDGGG